MGIGIGNKLGMDSRDIRKENQQNLVMNSLRWGALIVSDLKGKGEGENFLFGYFEFEV